MNNIEFISKLDDVLKHNTLYVMGCFGSPLINKNVDRYCNNHDYNKSAKRTAKIKEVRREGHVENGKHNQEEDGDTRPFMSEDFICFVMPKWSNMGKSPR